MAHYLDGKIIKGTTQDFFPNRPIFHILPVGASAEVEVQCRQLKAVFFVRDLDGDVNRKDLQGFLDGPGETARGKKVAVRFKDREIVCGYTLSYSPERVGFFMFPADPGSNNLRIYVLTYSTGEIRAGVGAEQMARKALEENAA